MKQLLYLDYRHFVNVTKLTLRSPKRLIPTVLIAGFVFLQLLQHVFLTYLAGKDVASRVTRLQPVSTDTVWAVAFSAIVAISLYLIYKSFSESLIIYGLSEIDFLFPTPTTRQLVGTYKVVKLYFKVAIFMGFMIAVMIPSLDAMVGPRAASYTPTSWLGACAFAVLLINVCVAINLTFSFRTDVGTRLRRAVRLASVGLIVVAGIAIAAVYLRTGDFSDSAAHVLRHPVFSLLLLPAAWAADLVVAPFTLHREVFPIRFAELGLAAAASFAFLLLRAKHTYEPSIEVSVRAAARKAAVRSGGLWKLRVEAWKTRGARVTRIVIPSLGRGAGAVVWKSALTALRTSANKAAILLILIPIAMIVVRAFLGSEIRPRTVVLATILGLFYAVWLITTFSVHSLRSTLKQTDILKPMPIAAWKVIVAETIPMAVFAALVVWVTTCSAALVFRLPPRNPLLLAGLGLPFAAYASICSQALIAVVYPNWEDFSQQWIGGTLAAMLSVISMGPPIAAGAILWSFGFHEALVAAIVAAVSLALAAGGIMVAAVAYARRDPTSE